MKKSILLTLVASLLLGITVNSQVIRPQQTYLRSLELLLLVGEVDFLDPS
jgi:hypothetical protein